ncbi:hypothetical protein [Roseinatronobacter monicus]|uniref:hypothetical protein n=1 Tax=Roseinatronobacter monicus TaxID=393481 RepID=UPI001BA52EE2|nr:hypothetical protein [Roseinatronobacter monicus]
MIGHDRFNTLIGLAFLAIILLSPDGVWGMGGRLVAALGWRRRNKTAVSGDTR